MRKRSHNNLFWRKNLFGRYGTIYAQRERERERERKRGTKSISLIIKNATVPKITTNLYKRLQSHFI